MGGSTIKDVSETKKLRDVSAVRQEPAISRV